VFKVLSSSATIKGLYDFLPTVMRLTCFMFMVEGMLGRWDEVEKVVRNRDTRLSRAEPLHWQEIFRIPVQARIEGQQATMGHYITTGS
jgi:hypothetical protein